MGLDNNVHAITGNIISALLVFFRQQLMNSNNWSEEEINKFTYLSGMYMFDLVDDIISAFIKIFNIKVEDINEKILNETFPQFSTPIFDSLILFLKNPSEFDIESFNTETALPLKKIIFQEAVDILPETYLLEIILPMLNELKDRISLLKKDFPPSKLIDEIEKTLSRVIQTGKVLQENQKLLSVESINEIKKRDSTFLPLPQLFKDPKKLDKILSILVHEENRYVLKDEVGNYTWHTKKIKLVAFALYCLNKNLLNESMLNLSTKIRESFCQFFNIKISQRSFQNTAEPEYYEYYIKDFERLLK